MQLLLLGADSMYAAAPCCCCHGGWQPTIVEPRSAADSARCCTLLVAQRLSYAAWPPWPLRCGQVVARTAPQRIFIHWCCGPTEPRPACPPSSAAPLLPARRFPLYGAIIPCLQGRLISYMKAVRWEWRGLPSLDALEADCTAVDPDRRPKARQGCGPTSSSRRLLFRRISIRRGKLVDTQQHFLSRRHRPRRW